MKATQRLFAIASQTRSMSSPFAIVAGVGPGTGATVARKFGATYPIALLARNPANYEEAVKEIQAAGGKAVGIPADVTDPKSVKDAIGKAQKELGGDKCAAAVFNVGGKFYRKPFLELTQQEFESGWEANGLALTFQKTILESCRLFANFGTILLLGAVPSFSPKLCSLSSSTPQTPNIHPP